MSQSNAIDTAGLPSGRRVTGTIWLGLGWILACEALLVADVVLSGRGAVRTSLDAQAVLAQEPATLVGMLARFVAINMTPLVWVGYIILLEGVLTFQTGASPVRRRPNHFASLALASIAIWCLFDAINFNRGMQAWRYIGIPEAFWQRAWGYVLAFAAIVPGMLMSGQVLLNAGLFDWARSPHWHMPRWAKWVALLAGVAMFLWPLWHANPVTNLTLWTSLVFLLDPINQKLGRPSMFRDWQAGWYGRTLAAFAGGLICGFLWEFWNYYALAKWTYHLPFLGSLEQVRYFEMPVLGLIGFIPFGIECWVMWQTMRIPLDGLVEPLPDEKSLL